MEQEGFRALIDARNMPLSPAVLRKMVVIADMIKGDPRFRGAFVGMKGMALSTTTIYAKTRRVNAKFCDTVEEAKDWLVKE